MATIADLLAEQGRMLAEMRLRRGEQKGALVAQLGQIPGQIMADRRAERERQDALARQAEADRRARATEERLRLADERQQSAFEAQEAERVAATEREALINRVYAEPGVLTDTGVNKTRALQVAQLIGPPGLARYVAEDIDKRFKTETPALMNRGALGVFDPVSRTTVPGTVAAPEPDKVTFGVPQDYMLNGQHVIARPGSDGRMYDQKGQPIAGTLAPYVAPRAPSTPTNPTEASLALAAAQGDPVAAKALETLRQGRPGAAGGVRLSVGQQEELATMKTVEDMIGIVNTLGDKIGWKGVGTLGTGTFSQMAMNFGWGTKEQETLRNHIANIQGTIAKLRGGTSFTTSEQAMLDRYTPRINDGDETIKAKLASLDQFIKLKRKNMLEFAGATPGANGSVRVGDVQTVRGQQMRVTQVYPDGTFDAEPVR